MGFDTPQIKVQSGGQWSGQRYKSATTRPYIVGIYWPVGLSAMPPGVDNLLPHHHEVGMHHVYSSLSEGKCTIAEFKAGLSAGFRVSAISIRSTDPGWVSDDSITLPTTRTSPGTYRIACNTELFGHDTTKSFYGFKSGFPNEDHTLSHYTITGTNGVSEYMRGDDSSLKLMKTPIDRADVIFPCRGDDGIYAIHSDGEIKSDPGMLNLWNSLNGATPSTMWHSSNFRSRPEPGFWSWYMWNEEEGELYSMWFHHTGNGESVSASMSPITDNRRYETIQSHPDPPAYRDLITNYEWTSKAFSTQGLVSNNDGCSGGSVTNWHFHGNHSLFEQADQGWKRVFVPWDVRFDKIGGNAESILGFKLGSRTYQPSESFSYGGIVNVPYSDLPNASLATVTGASIFTACSDSASASDGTYGTRAFVTQYDQSDKIALSVGPRSMLVIDGSTLLGASYNTVLSPSPASGETSTIQQDTFDGTKYEAYVSYLENLLKVQWNALSIEHDALVSDGNSFSWTKLRDAPASLAKTESILTTAQPLYLDVRTIAWSFNLIQGDAINAERYRIPLPYFH